MPDDQAYRGELVAIADEYGDERRSRLVQVEEARPSPSSSSPVLTP